MPIGVFVDSFAENTVDAGDAAPKVHVTRDGKDYDVSQGMPAYPGDVVFTDAGGDIIIAMLNDNVIELGASSRLTLGGDGTTPNPNSTITVNSGNVGVIAKSVLNETLVVAMGETSHPFAHTMMASPRAAPKPAAFEIITKSDGSGGFISTVAVSAGSVTLTPVNGQTVNLADALNAAATVMTTHNAVTGVSNSTVTFAAGNVSKTNLGILKTGALSDVLVKVGKPGSNTVAFTATIINGDGSKTTGKFSTLNGTINKDAWKTTGATKFSESWSESISSKGTKIAVKQAYTDSTGVVVSFSASLAGTTTAPGKASVKVGKDAYAGTATYDPTTGIITFVTTKSPKDGTTVTFKYDPTAAGGATNTAIVSTGGAPGTPLTHQTTSNAPGATTPDGRIITQNSAPKSQ